MISTARTGQFIKRCLWERLFKSSLYKWTYLLTYYNSFTQPHKNNAMKSNTDLQIPSFLYSWRTKMLHVGMNNRLHCGATCPVWGPQLHSVVLSFNRGSTSIAFKHHTIYKYHQKSHFVKDTVRHCERLISKHAG